jgi:L-lactate dehydrogenase complex protein LldG
MSAREEILARVDALGSHDDVAAAYSALDRPYVRAHHSEGLVDLFEQRVTHYKASVRRVAAADLAGAVAEAIGSRRVAVPGGLPVEWLSDVPAELLAAEPSLEPLALDRLGGVVTGCAAAIAETGTIILDHGPGQGPRALTLVPDYHLVVVFEEQIAADVPEALERIDPVRPLTFVSGPSATSDIELSRVEGVHGPRVLEVLLVPPPASPRTRS